MNESDKEAARNAALEDERAAFEDSERKRPEFSHHGEDTITPYTGVNGEHEYLLPFVQQRWVGWQARASMKSQPAQPSDTEIMLSDKEALEGVSEWLKTQELTVNVGPVEQGGNDCLMESSAGWLLRLVNAAMQADREGA